MTDGVVRSRSEKEIRAILEVRFLTGIFGLNRVSLLNTAIPKPPRVMHEVARLVQIPRFKSKPQT